MYRRLTREEYIQCIKLYNVPSRNKYIDLAAQIIDEDISKLPDPTKTDQLSDIKVLKLGQKLGLPLSNHVIIKEHTLDGLKFIPGGKTNLLQDINTVLLIIFNLTPIKSDVKPPEAIPNKIIVSDLDFSGGISRFISLGSFGDVYQTEYGYAIKTISDFDDYTLNEIACLRYLSHPNIIPLYGVQLNLNETYCLAMSLANFTLDECDLSKLEYRQIIFYQLFRGINYCHQSEIWHLDMKPANVLVFDVNGFPQVKITDFGLSQFQARPSNEVRATTEWRPPELFKNGLYNSKVDIWSLGIMMLNAIEGKLIIDASKLNGYNGYQKLCKLIDRIQGHKLKSDTVIDLSITPEEYHPHEWEVLQNAIALDWVRSSASQILELPYFLQVKNMVDQIIPEPKIKIDDKAVILHEDDRVEKLLWGWQEMESREVNYRTRFYTVSLFDRIKHSEHPEDTFLDCLYIAVRLFDYNSKCASECRSLWKTHLDRYHLILDQIDGQLAFPTLDDRIYKLTPNLTEDSRKPIQKIGYLLYLNSQFTEQLTLTQLAEESISYYQDLKTKKVNLDYIDIALDSNESVLDHHNSNSSIYEYLNSVINPPFKN